MPRPESRKVFKVLCAKFKTVLADPPWPYQSPRAIVGNGGRGSQEGRASSIIQTSVTDHYDVMTIDEIASLRVTDHVEKDAHLYLWTTNSFIVQAHDIARAWGFIPKTILTWVKVCKNDCFKPSMKTGYWYRSATEHVLFCVRGSLRLRGPAFPTAFLSPRLPHSVKPDEMYNLVEQQSPGPYLELFARRLRNGWDSWGNQVRSTVTIKVQYAKT